MKYIKKRKSRVTEQLQILWNILKFSKLEILRQWVSGFFFFLDSSKYFTQAALAQCHPQKAFIEKHNTLLQNSLYNKSYSPLMIAW